MKNTKPKVSKVPENETKNEKAKRIGERRINNVLKGIRLLGNLSGSAYELTDEQKSTIVTSLKNEVVALEQKLNKVKTEAVKVTL